MEKGKFPTAKEKKEGRSPARQDWLTRDGNTATTNPNYPSLTQDIYNLYMDSQNEWEEEKGGGSSDKMWVLLVQWLETRDYNRSWWHEKEQSWIILTTMYNNADQESVGKIAFSISLSFMILAAADDADTDDVTTFEDDSIRLTPPDRLIGSNPPTELPTADAAASSCCCCNSCAACNSIILWHRKLL